jgi:hypothetical protein
VGKNRVPGCMAATPGSGDRVMATLTRRKDDQVIWMADCYDLAKRFPNAHTWLSLLEPLEQSESDLNPFHYWLWMEIWKAAQDAEVEAS